MRGSLWQGVLKYLALVSFAVSTGGIDPGPSLIRVPADVLLELVDDVDQLEGELADRRRILSLLARDRRVAVRAQVARTAAALWSEARDDCQRMLHQLADDSSPRVRAAAGVGLARVLEHAGPLERVSLVAEWALAPSPERRATLAVALARPVPVFIESVAIEHLANDARVEIRRLALWAARRRALDAPAAYRRIALTRTADDDLCVRRSARRLLDRLDRRAPA